jgi:hypothetical protein
VRECFDHSSVASLNLRACCGIDYRLRLEPRVVLFAPLFRHHGRLLPAPDASASVVPGSELAPPPFYSRIDALQHLRKPAAARGNYSGKQRSLHSPITGTYVSRPIATSAPFSSSTSMSMTAANAPAAHSRNRSDTVTHCRFKIIPPG